MSLSGYRPQLDGLRAVAVLSVALQHWYNLTVFGVEPPFGFLGVGLFFVLSGYLITNILLDVRRRAEATGASLFYATRSFTVRRILRLVPALYVYLVAVWLLGYSGDSRGLAWYALYAGNFRLDSLGHWPAGVAHLWSLGVEEQYYLLAPVFVLFFPRRGMTRALVALVLLTAIIGSVVELPVILPPSAFVGLLVGSALAVEVAKGSHLPAALRRAWPAVTLLAVVTMSLRLYGLAPPESRAVGELLTFVAMAVVVHRAAEGFSGITGRVLASRPAVAVGRISYGVYLWHFIAPHLRQQLDGVIDTQPAPIEFVLTASITLAIAAASDRFVERHFRDLKQRHPYVRESTRSSVEPARRGALATP